MRIAHRRFQFHHFNNNDQYPQLFPIKFQKHEEYYDSYISLYND